MPKLISQLLIVENALLIVARAIHASETEVRISDYAFIVFCEWPPAGQKRVLGVADKKDYRRKQALSYWQELRLQIQYAIAVWQVIKELVPR